MPASIGHGTSGKFGENKAALAASPIDGGLANP